MTPPSVALVTDSTCDIPSELIQHYAISVVSHYVIWGNEEYRDRVTLQPEDFYKRLESDHQKPTTAQATSNDFADAYRKVISLGAKEIIVLTVSSAMSGAYQMALNAANAVHVPVHVVDSKGPTMSLGWQVLAAAREREAGKETSAILSKVDQVRQALTQVVGMDTIEFLQYGGRIGDAAKWIGSMLHVKPVVTINHQTGRVEPVGVARTHKGMVDMLYQKFSEKMKGLQPLHVAILHGNIPVEAAELAERVVKELAPVEVLINITGPVLGINTGPRALALCGYAG